MKQILLILLAICATMVFADAKKQTSDKRTKILLQTDKGNITIALFGETPLHKENFIKLTKEHYFDGMLFHRVIKDFMIQTGDPKSKNAPDGALLGEGDPGYTIPAEIQFPKLFHKRGMVAAAREGDRTNPQKASSGSQFYIVWGKDFSTDEINEMCSQLERRSRGAVHFPDDIKQAYVKYGGTPHLDGGYTVFGEVIDGMKVVDKIQEVRTDHNDRPFDNIKIIKASIIK